MVVVEFQIMTDNDQQVISWQMRLPGSCLDPTQTHKNSVTVLHRVLTEGHKVICDSGGAIAIVKRDPKCKMTVFEGSLSGTRSVTGDRCCTLSSKFFV